MSAQELLGGRAFGYWCDVHQQLKSADAAAHDVPYAIRLGFSKFVFALRTRFVFAVCDWYIVALAPVAAHGGGAFAEGLHDMLLPIFETGHRRTGINVDPICR